MTKYKRHISSLGDAAANLIAAACYLCVLVFWSFGIVPILAIFFVEKKSGLVRFHAMQAALLWLVRVMFGGGLPFEGLAAVLTGDMGYLHFAHGWSSDMFTILIRLGIGILIAVLCVMAAVQAYYWRDWKIPFIGLIAQIIVRHSAPAAYNGEATVPYECRIGYTDDKKPEWSPKWEQPQAAAPPPIYMEDDVPVEAAEAPPEWQTAITLEEDAPAPEEALAKVPFLGKLVSGIRRDFAHWGAAKEDDPNQQLPPEMRDAAPPAEMRATERAATRGWARMEPAPPPAAQAPEQPLEPPPEGADYEALFQQRMEAAGHTPVLERLFAKFSNQGLHSPEQQGDPNGQLPPDMRDPPPPDMF